MARSIAAVCRRSSVPGDLVLTNPTKGEFACVGYVGPKGQTTIGWLTRPAPTAAPEPEQAPKDRTGRWVVPAQEITMKASRSDQLVVTANATWGDTPERRNTGSVHAGEIEGSMAPKDGALAFAMGDDGRTLPHEAGGDYACRIRIIRRGPYLVARDNNGCGGANVSFSGLYRRADWTRGVRLERKSPAAQPCAKADGTPPSPDVA